MAAYSFVELKPQKHFEFGPKYNPKIEIKFINENIFIFKHKYS